MNKIQSVTDMKDLLGQTLRVGMVITYPVRRGSCMWMSLAIIKSETPETLSTGRKSCKQCTLEKEHLHVYVYSQEKNHLVPSTIYCTDRTIRIHPDNYDDRIKQMVSTFWKTKVAETLINHKHITTKGE